MTLRVGLDFRGGRLSTGDGLDICDLNISELIYQIKAGLLIQATEHRNLSANMAAHTHTHAHTDTLTHT